jgi:hypothetical protein
MITQRQWEAGWIPAEMLRSALAWAKNPERKRIFYTAALVRQFWDELPWICQMTTELSERLADGEFDEAALGRPLEYIAEGAMYCAEFAPGLAAWEFPHAGIASYERYLIEAGFGKPRGADFDVGALTKERFVTLAWLAYAVPANGGSVGADMHSVPLLHDIFGNPFRPVAFDPAWRTDTVVSLAKGLYESRDFSAMPILADALQDAGCDCDDILNHCRDESLTHVRGCWVVDLVLGM